MDDLINNMGDPPEHIDFDFNFDNISASALGDPTAREVALRQEYAELAVDNGEIVDFELSLQRVRVETMSLRAELFEKQGLITFEDMTIIQSTADEAMAQITSIEGDVIRVKRAMKKLADQEMDLLQNPTGNVMSETAQLEMERLSSDMAKLQAQKKIAIRDLTSKSAELTIAKEKLNEAERSGASAEEVKEAEAGVESAETAVTASKSRWIRFRDLEEKYGSKVDRTIEYFKDYEGLFSYDVVTKPTINLIGNIMSKIHAPFRSIGTKIKLAGDRLFKGYEKFAEDLIEGGDLDKFYNNVKGSIDKTAESGVKRIQREVDAYANLVKKDASIEEIVATTASFNSPSWKLFASIEDDIQLAGNLKLDMFLIFAPVKWGLIGLKTATKAIGSGLALVVESIGQGLGGDVGWAIASSLTEVIIGAVGFVAEAASTILGPEVQSLYFLAKVAVDGFTSHNMYEFEEKAVHDIPGVNLLVDFNKLKIKEYPVFSKIKRMDERFALNADYMDAFENHMVLDFWGSQYIKIMNKKGQKYPPYKKWTELEAVLRIPGLFVYKPDANEVSVKINGMDPKDYTIDSTHRQICVDIEKNLSEGTLVLANDVLSTKDRGQNLLSNVFPNFQGALSGQKDMKKVAKEMDGMFVRNWVDFPLFDNTMRWPSLEGEPKAINGTVTAKDIDPVIWKQFQYWATTGTWGPEYNLATNAKTARDIVNTNKQDLKFWLKPDRNNDPLAWVKVKHWLDGNRGKKRIMRYNMYQFQINNFEEEYNKPIQTSRLVADHNEYENLLTRERHHSISDLAIQYWKRRQGKWPIHDDAITYYKMVVDGEYFHAWRNHWNPDPIMTHWAVKPVKSTNEQKVFFQQLLQSLDDYRDSLVAANGNAEKAFALMEHDQVWKEYIEDTVNKRTVDGYIREYFAYFLAELEAVTKNMLGKRKTEVMAQYMKLVANAGVPLNMNSYHRSLFMGQMNQMMYLNDKDKLARLQGEFDGFTGGFIENRLISTNTQKIKATAWYNLLRGRDIFEVTYDLPVSMGGLQCRMVVFKKPKMTLVICFRGTTNNWEKLIDADFTGTEYAALNKTGKEGDEYGMHVFKESDSAASMIKNLIYTDPTKFSVHRGFLRAWLGFKDQVIKQTKEFYAKYAIEDVMVTGHSLGAAIGQLCCMELPGHKLRGSYVRPHFYGFASPAVGDRRFANMFKKQTRESIQLYINGDPITMLPPFLVPDTESIGSKINTALEDIVELEKMEGNKMAQLFGIIGFLMGKNILHLPKPLNPVSFMEDGQFSPAKLLGNIHTVWKSYNDHKAVRAGGLFIRLDAADNGDDVEEPYDIGSTSDIIVQSFGQHPAKIVKDRHSISNIIAKLSNVVKRHPDAFAIDGGEKLPSWDDANVQKVTTNKRKRGSDGIFRKKFRRLFKV